MVDLHLGKWSEIHKENMTGFCNELGIKLHIVDLKKEFGRLHCMRGYKKMDFK
jgi:tRNA(Ile)-lysidine synthase TilS/MesJ